MKEPIVGIHTTFIPKENIPFMAEWIAYYYEMGVEKFYLYDNGEVQNGGFPGCIRRFGPLDDGINRRSFNYDKFVKMTLDEVEFAMEYIVNMFPEGVVNFIEWSPINDDGKVVYGQMEALAHSWNMYKDEVDWMINADMDEFLISPVKFPKLLHKYRKCDVVTATVHDRCRCRHSIRNMLVVECDSFYKALSINPKYIYRTSSKNIRRLKIHDVVGVRKSHVKICELDGSELRMNHYNFIKLDSTFKNKEKSSSWIPISSDIINNIKLRLMNSIGSVAWKETILEADWSEYWNRSKYFSDRKGIPWSKRKRNEKNNR